MGQDHMSRERAHQSAIELLLRPAQQGFCGFDPAHALASREFASAEYAHAGAAESARRVAKIRSRTPPTCANRRGAAAAYVE
jgi:hypothetical protein